MTHPLLQLVEGKAKEFRNFQSMGII